MIQFYRDREKQYIVPDLLSEKARAVAEKIRQNRELKSSQFRNYFQELRALEARYRADRQKSPQGAWLRLEPQLQLFKAKLAYGARKDGPLVNATEFRSFMEEVVDSIQEAKDFEAAMLYVEAVLAYFYALEMEGKNKRGRQQGRYRR